MTLLTVIVTLCYGEAAKQCTVQKDADLSPHRRSQGVHPQGGEKNRRNLLGKCVSAPQYTKCTPWQAEQESI